MKLTLDTNYMTDCFFEETKLLGIMAPVKDYQFCWHMNNCMGVDFRINNEIEIQLTRKGRNYFFAVYEYAEVYASLTHYLYNNQHEGEYLLPQFKHLDFLWLLKGDNLTTDTINYMIGSIRNIKGVQLVLELAPENMRNKEHLVF